MNGTTTEQVGTTGALHRSLTYNDVSHAYMLDGLRCRSVTNIAKIPTDDYVVNQWRHRMAALGFILDPSLLEDIAAHRYDNKRCEDTVQRAINLAGGDAAARRGIQYHAASEFHDLREPLLTEQQHRDVNVWARTLDAYGIRIDDRYIERIVLYPDDLIAGRIDRYAWIGDDLFDVDIKTGINAWKYPHGTAVQLALHVRAPFIAGMSSFDGGIEHVDEWWPQPAELRTDIAFILSMPTSPDEEVGTLWKFHLTGRYAGHVAAEIAITARHFQLNDNLCEMVPVPVRPAWHPSMMTPQEVRAIEDAPLPDDTQPRLLARIEGLAELDKARLRGMWRAENLPTIQLPMSDADLVRATVLVDEVDPFVKTSFVQNDDGTWSSAPVLSGPVRRQFAKPDEGVEADTVDVMALSTMYLKLPDTPKARVNELAAQAAEYGCGFHVAERNSERRYFIVNALVALAVNGSCDDDTLRGLVAAVTNADDVYDPSTPAGAWVGSLHASQAILLARTVGLFLAGAVAMRFETDGRVRFTPPTNNDTTE